MPTRTPRRRRFLEVVDFCHEHVAATGSPPSYSTICAALRITDAGTVRRYVKQAEAAGLLSLGAYSKGRGGRLARIRLPGAQRPAEACA